MTYKHGLPISLPIANGMKLGERNQDELEWLLEHGVIQSDIYRYRKIVKITDNDYQMLMYPDVYGNPDQLMGRTDTLQELLLRYVVDLAGWYWYEE